MNTDFQYNLEIDELCPISKQPDLIKTTLKPHQLASLQKAKIMETTGGIKYNIKYSIDDNVTNLLDSLPPDKYSIKTNIGIIGDIVGYGKTLTALSLIADCKLDDIYINKIYDKSIISNVNYSYFRYSTFNKKIKNNNSMINSSLVIVPRGPVYVQWLRTIKEDTKLKYLAIENLNFIKKNLPSYDDIKENENCLIDYFNKYDIVLIKNTTLNVLIDYYNNIFPENQYFNFNLIKNLYRWKRIIIDEAHDISKSIPLLHYYYLWLISGTYQEIINTIRTPNSLLWDVRNIFNDSKNIKLMLIKCKREFVRNSFKLPIPEEKYYLCKMPIHFHTIKDYVSANILEKLNANDIEGAIKDLGGKTDTQDNIVNLITNDMNIELENKKKELEYVSTLVLPEDTKKNKIAKIENDIDIINNKLINLTNRISELSKKTCAICTEYITDPILLKCTHAYCAICLFNWIKNKSTCPECRDNINSDELIAITDNVNNSCKNEKVILNKIETLLNIINNKPNGKFLLFSKFDKVFFDIIDKLNSNNITYAELKGNTSHMMNILNNFKNSDIRVILLNTFHAGSGIDISYATDVIIFHSMGLYKNQAVGRAQRVGRIDKLTIHNLCYEQEMP